MLFTATKPSDVMPASSGSCLRHCLRHTLRVCLFILVIALVVKATPQFFSDDDFDDVAVRMPDKRPARLSYFRAPYRHSRGRYDSYSPYGYGSQPRYAAGGYGDYDWWRKKAVDRYQLMPWEYLPNTNCLRKFCKSDDDCCRRYSKCNSQAHVCYDCWYGHPCSSNKDCCQKYPYCNPVLNTCGK